MPDAVDDPLSPVGFPRAGKGIRALNRSSQIILVLLAVLLLALGGLMYRTIVFQREAQAHGSHEVESILALHGMLESLIDAETGERGFELNGEQEYLQPLSDSRAIYTLMRRRAGELIGHSSYAGESQDLAPLDALVHARLALIDENVAAVRAGRRDMAISLERSALGKARMDKVRHELSRLEIGEQRQRLDALSQASRNEARIVPLLMLLGVAIAVLVIMAVLLERRHAIALTRAQQADALAAANTRAELVAKELNHRVKNLFAVILSIVSLTGRRRGADRETIDELRARIHALSIAHAVSQGQIGSDSADLAELVRRVLEPYTAPDDGRVTMEGPAVEMPVRTVTPLGLIVHELATNAVKYGALSHADGAIAIRWDCCPSATGGSEIRLVWIESGGPALLNPENAGTNSGFGSTMLTLAAQQLDGILERRWNETGAEVHLVFPVAD